MWVVGQATSKQQQTNLMHGININTYIASSGISEVINHF